MRTSLQRQIRILMLGKLVAEFAHREMTITSIVEHLEISESGARKYMHDLLAARIITPAGVVDPSRVRSMTVFAITADQALVARFLANMAQGVLPSRNAPVLEPAPTIRQARAAFRHPQDIAFFGLTGGARI